MGSMVSVIDKKDFMTKLLPKAKRLCRDFNWESRKAICLNIHKISLQMTQEETD
jgi:hypothetical protein